jgi:transposase InsO family protein
MVVHYGFLKRLHYDTGANFEGELIKELCAMSGMSKSRTTPYHAMSNGMCERMHRTLKDMLGMLNPEQKQDWKTYVAPKVHAYNSINHQSTSYPKYFFNIWQRTTFEDI